MGYTKPESTTSLDALYELLLEKKVMNIDDIAAQFNVSKGLVAEWGKILEAGELATINNPRIGKASIRLAGYVGEEPKKEEPKEESIKKETKAEENIMQMNKSIKDKNKEKIKEAKEIILKAKQNGFDNESIKEKFVSIGWPQKLIEDLLN